MKRIPGTHPRVTMQAYSWLVLVHGKPRGSVSAVGESAFQAQSAHAETCPTFATRTAAARWVVAQFDATLPTIESLSGAIPDFTGDLTTEEHLRRIRGGA